MAGIEALEREVAQERRNIMELKLTDKQKAEETRRLEMEQQVQEAKSVIGALQRAYDILQEQYLKSSPSFRARLCPSREACEVGLIELGRIYK